VKPLTFAEVCERLRRWDEITLVETLGLTTEDLIGAFADRIEDKLEELTKEVEE
jgi:hypothetical protein